MTLVPTNFPYSSLSSVLLGSLLVSLIAHKRFTASTYNHKSANAVQIAKYLRIVE